MSGRREELDATPVEWPLHLKRPPTLAEEIQRLVKMEVSRVAEEAGLESFEEADDFDLDDEDGVPTSPHELNDLQADMPRGELTRREKELRMALEREKGGSDVEKSEKGDRPAGAGEKGAESAQKGGEANRQSAQGTREKGEEVSK